MQDHGSALMATTCPQGHPLEPQDQGARRCPTCGLPVAPAQPPPGDDPARAVTVSQGEAVPAAPAADTRDYTPEPPGATGPGKHITVPPARVAGYEILGELGRGGTGVVYRAQHLALGRLVALKMILVGAHAGTRELDRFRREAEAVARLAHPNVVQIYEVGEHGGLPFLALEFVDGGPLAQRLQGTPLSAKEAAQLVQTLARAMDYAHRHGVVHRDLKPGNVLLASGATEAGRDAVPLSAHVPKIADFGLAKQLGTESIQTQTGVVVGTPSYMAPEQARADKDIGPAADVYALGAILYELLTGRPPFRAATPLDTVMQVLHEEPVPPRRLQPRVPADLETVCLKCLAKDPRQRYASALELAEDLRRFQAGEPIRARRVGPLGQGWRWVRRNPVPAGLVAALVLALVGGTAGVTWSYLGAEAAREREALAHQREAEQRDLAEV